MGARRKKRILVAERPGSHGVMLAALGSHFNVIPCGSLVEAKMALHQDFDLVACGMNFDESRMFDLLRYIKSTPPIRTIPFLGMKVAEGILEQSIFDGVDKAARSLGADKFVDFARWRDELGDEKAHETLRETIDQILQRETPPYHNLFSK